MWRFMNTEVWYLKLWVTMNSRFGTLLGIAGSQNDFNVLQRSRVFARPLEGHAPSYNYEIDAHLYSKEHYLSDGIYPI